MNTPNNAAALLPCPFCGGPASVIRASGNEVWNQSWHVGCAKCGVQMKEWGSNSWAQKKTEDEAAETKAIGRWNRRALPQPAALTSQPSEVKRWQPSSFMEPGRSHVYARMQESDHGAFVLFDDYQKLLNSQPSGESVSIPVVQQTAPERIWLAVADDAYYADKPFPDGEEVCWSSDAPLQVCVPYVRADLATHPSADAPGVAVDDEMVNRALKVWYGDDLEAHDMRAALTAALAPKPEGEL